MDRLHQINPFAKRDSHGPAAVVTYKVLTFLSWLLAAFVSVWYVFKKPCDGGHTIWRQNYKHQSGFTLDEYTTDSYWIILFILQLVYQAHLFSSKVEHVNAACSVGSHFILNNLLHFAFVMLFVCSHFVWAEVVLLCNFCNLTSLYYRHNAYPRFIHWPAVSAPLAWTFVAILWDGAMMFHHPDALLARIFANVFVWAILFYGLFYIIVYKDYTMGFSLGVLSAALGVEQFTHQAIALQWIFAFTIMATLFVFTVIVALPAWTGRELAWPRRHAATDAERAPLLADPAARQQS